MNDIDWSITLKIKIRNFGHPPPNKSMHTQNKIIEMVFFLPLFKGLDHFALVVIGSSKLWMKKMDDLFITRPFFKGLAL
jgi:hypothetical protein